MLYIIGSIGLLVFGYWMLFLWSNSRLERIRSSRGRDTIQSFIKEFGTDLYSQKALEIAYEDLVEITTLPVRKDDDLQKTLGLVPEDFDRMLESRCGELGVVDVFQSSYSRMFPLKTVGDYVRFLNEVLKKENHESS